VEICQRRFIVTPLHKEFSCRQKIKAQFKEDNIQLEKIKKKHKDHV